MTGRERLPNRRQCESFEFRHVDGAHKLSEEFKAHLAYLDGIIDDIRMLDTARSEQRIRRACLNLIKGGGP